MATKTPARNKNRGLSKKVIKEFAHKPTGKKGRQTPTPKAKVRPNLAFKLKVVALA
jgi:hypothetical protein